MKLFLASEAKHPETIRKLDKYVNGLKNKKIAYIPTAANGEGWESWKEGGSWNLVQSLDIDLELVLLEDRSSSEIVDIFKTCDILWFAGGLCGYLMYWMRRRQLDKNLPEILQNGALYVGSSAGSMVTGNSLEISEWYPADMEYGAHFIPGLGLVDFEIYPHFEDSQFEEVKKMYKGKKLYLLKNGEEIIVEDSNVIVNGEERIIENG